VNLGDARPQKSRQLELPFESRGEAPRAGRSGEAPTARNETEHSATSRLLEEVVQPSNLREAMKRVMKNAGSPGVDGMTVEELPDHLRNNWPAIREQLLAGSYQPSPVRRKAIPKPGGGERELGIPTVLDRFIQQAVLQVLQPRFDPSFSQHSYGFRPGRSAHDAIRAAQRYVQEGRRVVVDVDLEKFFDRVNHDVLMGKLAHRIADRRLLRLIRRYLEAGVLANGVVGERYEGTPQGGPLSPLLANVLLDDVDQELDRRGLAFARYADDCNIYVRSKRAGERVLASLRKLYARLRLRVNEAKSAVAFVRERQFLGMSFWDAPGKVVRRRLAPKALTKLKDRVRELTRRNAGRSIAQMVQALRNYLRGWQSYFGIVETPQALTRLDQWIRHRLRAVHLKQWRRGTTTYNRLMALGNNRDAILYTARHTRSWWRTAGRLLGTILDNRYFDQLGVPRLGP
jgi:RNA-directed DNA polymerase